MPNISQHHTFPTVDRQRAIDSLIFISRSEVERITGMSRSWIYQAMAENNFPRPVRASASRRWILAEVQMWMQKKISERDVVIEQRARIRSNSESCEK